MAMFFFRFWEANHAISRTPYQHISHPVSRNHWRFHSRGTPVPDASDRWKSMENSHSMDTHWSEAFALQTQRSDWLWEDFMSSYDDHGWSQSQLSLNPKAYYHQRETLRSSYTNLQTLQEIQSNRWQTESSTSVSDTLKGPKPGSLLSGFGGQV